MDTDPHDQREFYDWGALAYLFYIIVLIQRFWWDGGTACLFRSLI